MFVQTLLALVALGCISCGAIAQETGIKVTTLLHDDGSKTVTRLDIDQHTSEEVTTNAADKVLKRIVFNLDANNLPQSGVLYAPNGKVVRKIVYKYDALNRVNEEADYTPNDQLLGRFVYEYSASGRVSKIHTFDAAGNEVGATATDARKDEHKQPPRIQH